MVQKRAQPKARSSLTRVLARGCSTRENEFSSKRQKFHTPLVLLFTAITELYRVAGQSMATGSIPLPWGKNWEEMKTCPPRKGALRSTTRSPLVTSPHLKAVSRYPTNTCPLQPASNTTLAVVLSTLTKQFRLRLLGTRH